MLVEFAFGIVEIPDDVEAYESQDTDVRYCSNCLDETYVPDDRTGLIHKHGRYACFTVDDKGREHRLSTVAE